MGRIPKLCSLKWNQLIFNITKCCQSQMMIKPQMKYLQPAPIWNLDFWNWTFLSKILDNCHQVLSKCLFLQTLHNKPSLIHSFCWNCLENLIHYSKHCPLGLKQSQKLFRNSWSHSTVNMHGNWWENCRMLDIFFLLGLISLKLWQEFSVYFEISF